MLVSWTETWMSSLYLKSLMADTSLPGSNMVLSCSDKKTSSSCWVFMPPASSSSSSASLSSDQAAMGFLLRASAAVLVLPALYYMVKLKSIG